MFTENFAFIRNGIKCTGSGDFFEDFDEELLNNYYFSWKELNKINKTYGMRRINLPELLSEGLSSMLFGWVRTNASIISGCPSSSCDLIDLDSGELIQLKSCSTWNGSTPGPTSFGPRTEFDKLIFMHLDCDNNIAKFYELDSNTYKDWKVNRVETIADQQAQGRRPRVSILPKIKEYNINPFFTYTFKNSIKGE